MKKASYILGILSCLILFIGSMFKVMHWPGAAIMLIVGIFSFVLIFLPVSLIHHYNTSAGKKNLWLHIVTFLTALTIFTSALFKILHWPGAGYMLLFSIPIPFLVFLPVFIYTSRKNNTSTREYSYVLILFLFYALTASLLSLNISRNIINEGLLSLREWSNVEQNSILSIQSALTQEKTFDTSVNTKIEKIHANSELLTSTLDKMIKDMATAVNSNNEQAFGSDGKIDFLRLVSLDQITSGDREFEIGKEGVDLKKKVNEFKNLLLSEASIKNTETSELILRLLDTSESTETTWEAANFGRFHFIWLLNSFASLKSNVRVCEAAAINSLSNPTN
jgi:hypothetical protein